MILLLLHMRVSILLVNHPHSLPFSFNPCAAAAWNNVEVGSDVTAMVAMVQAAHPTMRVLAVPEGGMMTRDFDLSRVRIFHDEDMKVTRKPRQG